MLKLSSAKTASHRILVLNNSDYEPPRCIDTKTWIVHQDDLNKRISICLLEPLHRWLFKWNKEIKKGQFKNNLNTRTKNEIHKEIELICTEISLERSGVVPTNVKDYLFR